MTRLPASGAEMRKSRRRAAVRRCGRARGLRAQRKRTKAEAANRSRTMDLLSPRQSDIVDLAKAEGRVSVEGLADRFSVTPQTIRKDLNDLCERGVLQRFHG